jgi:hypothetical protein
MIYTPFIAFAIGLIMIAVEGRKTPVSKYSGYKRDNGEV